MTEKILARKSGQDARAGDIVVCNIDYALGSDASLPMALDYFREMGGTNLFDPTRIIVAADHYAPPPNEKAAALLERVREFCRDSGAILYDAGQGVGHQLMVEKGFTMPGGLVVGADSHAVTYGATNCFGTGIGSSDLAAAMISGQVWLRIPETIRVELTGTLSQGVYAKDAALALCGMLGADGAAYKALEFHGDAIPGLTMDDRMTIANMVVEMGAKNGIFPCDEVTEAWLAGRARGDWSPVSSDPNAEFDDEVTVDLASLEPQVARPHLVDNVGELKAEAGTRVDMAYLGTCTGGRAEDFRIARDILKAGGGPAENLQVVVTPASEAVRQELEGDGTLADFIAMGAVVQTPGCGGCCGTCGVGVADGMNVISTANRNFKGRMGNPEASIWLASPASCARAAVTGKIPGEAE